MPERNTELEDEVVMYDIYHKEPTAWVDDEEDVELRKFDWEKRLQMMEED